jgi:hypothetical protein
MVSRISFKNITDSCDVTSQQLKNGLSIACIVTFRMPVNDNDHTSRFFYLIIMRWKSRVG